jgi:hypothetical protein
MTSKLLNKRQAGKIRIFFRSKAWSNVLIFLSFVALATVFRISMSSEKNADSPYNEVAETVAEEKTVVAKSGKHTKQFSETLTLTVICFNLPADKNVRFFPPEIKLTVKTDKKFPEINSDDFEVGADYAKMLEISGACTLTLSKKPDWVKEYSLSPSIVEFQFE